MLGQGSIPQAVHHVQMDSLQDGDWIGVRTIVQELFVDLDQQLSNDAISIVRNIKTQVGVDEFSKSRKKPMKELNIFLCWQQRFHNVIGKGDKSIG